MSEAIKSFNKPKNCFYVNELALKKVLNIFKYQKLRKSVIIFLHSATFHLLFFGQVNELHIQQTNYKDLLFITIINFSQTSKLELCTKKVSNKLNN